jgi:hypothetical protein
MCDARVQLVGGPRRRKRLQALDGGRRDGEITGHDGVWSAKPGRDGLKPVLVVETTQDWLCDDSIPVIRKNSVGAQSHPLITKMHPAAIADSEVLALEERVEKMISGAAAVVFRQYSNRL